MLIAVPAGTTGGGGGGGGGGAGSGAAAGAGAVVPLPPAPRPVGWFQFGPEQARRPVAWFRFGPEPERRLEAPQTHCCLSLVLTCTRPAPGSELTRLMRLLISFESSVLQVQFPVPLRMKLYTDGGVSPSPSARADRSSHPAFHGHRRWDALQLIRGYPWLRLDSRGIRCFGDRNLRTWCESYPRRRPAGVTIPEGNLGGIRPRNRRWEKE